jgi:presequence protease
MDMAERLEWMDKEYLSKFDKITVDSQIAKQKPFEKPVEHKIFYPVGENDSEEENTYLTYSMVVGDGLDVKRCTAFEVLDYVLLSAPGAPLRQALLDAGIISAKSYNFR